MTVDKTQNDRNLLMYEMECDLNQQGERINAAVQMILYAPNENKAARLKTLERVKERIDKAIEIAKYNRAEAAND